MTITQVEAIVLRLPQVSAAADGTQDTCLIRIDTDSGMSGWGEVDSYPTAVKAVVDAPMSHSNCSGLARVLVGMDPLAIDVCNHRMRVATNYYSSGGVAVHAMAGVDMALWDIAGKALDKPIYQLLGGPFQTRMRAYSSVLFGDTVRRIPPVLARRNAAPRRPRGLPETLCRQPDSDCSGRNGLSSRRVFANAR